MRLLELIFGKIIYLISSFYKDKCKKCKTILEIEKNSDIYLLPLNFDDEYEASSDYYLKNCFKIKNLDEIPIGRRACCFIIYKCLNCGEKSIYVNDFLYVRGNKVVKKINEYPYNDFAEFLILNIDKNTYNYNKAINSESNEFFMSNF